MKLRGGMIAGHPGADASCADKCSKTMLRGRILLVSHICLILGFLLASPFTTPLQAQWISAPAAIDPAELPDQPDIFGTIAIPIRARPTSSRWTKVVRASLEQPRLYELTAHAEGLPRSSQAAFVQKAVSEAINVQRSAYDCADDGYWAPAEQTLARGVGDCIDIAVAKMEALRLLGVPNKDLYLITGYANAGNAAKRESAALLVKIGGDFWLMPEGAHQLVKASMNQDEHWPFQPMVTYGVGRTWVHGRQIKIDQSGTATGPTQACCQPNASLSPMGG